MMFDTFNIPQLGELEVLEVYQDHNGPHLCSCKNTASHLYMALYAKDLPEHELWLFTAVSPGKLNLIRSGKININEVFYNPQTKRILKVLSPHPYCENAKFSSDYITPDQLGYGVFPLVEQYINFEDVSLPKITNDATSVEIAKSLNANVIDVGFADKYSSKPLMQSVGRTFTNFQGLIDSIRIAKTKPLGLTQQTNQIIRHNLQFYILAFEPWSFNIKAAANKNGALLFESNDFIDQGIYQNTIYEAINIMRLKSVNSETKQKFEELHPNIFERYHYLINSLNMSNSDATFSWSSPDTNKQEIVSLSKKEISNLAGFVRTFTEQESIINITGELTGIFLRTKRFEMISGDKKYSGSVVNNKDENIKNAVISGVYDADIRETIKRSRSGIRKEIHTLLNLKPVD